MVLQKLDRSEWSAFCDLLSRGLSGKRVEIEVASPESGAHIQAHWLPLKGMVYDPTSDALEIVLDGLDHLIFHPLELYVDYGPGGVETLGILDAESAWQIVQLRNPLLLPSAVAEARVSPG